MNFQNRTVPANEPSLPALFFGPWYVLKFLLCNAHEMHIYLLFYLGHTFATMVAMSHFSVCSTDGHKFSGRHWISCSTVFFKHRNFSIFRRHASNPFHYGRKNMTAMCCWLVTDDEINIVLWLVCRALYCSNTEYITVLCVLKNPIIQEHGLNSVPT